MSYFLEHCGVAVFAIMGVLAAGRVFQSSVVRSDF